jgi:biopolymer transport protein ExbD
MAGLLDKKRERDEAEINTASLADIAFLLLIFFLVATTINVDTGIGMTLPPKLEDQEPPPVKERNMLNILVNAQGDVLLEDEPSAVGRIREEVRTHVTNYGQDPNYATGPDNAVVSIKTDQETTYDTYIRVLDEVWMAYREIWDGVARTNQLPNGESAELGQTYPSYNNYRSSLGPEDENLIRERIGAQISIAEPDVGQ